MYRATGSSEFAQISIDGPIPRCMKRSSLQARPGRCAYCTNARFTFLGSPSPFQPFDLNLISVQPLYRGTGGSEFAQISNDGPIWQCMKRTSLQARPGWCAFSTNTRFTFSGSPSPLLPFHIHLASVKSLYWATRSCEFAQIPIDGPIRQYMKRTILQARLGRCAFCTNAKFTFSGTPYP